jgi:ERCC4-type nuclease
VKIPAELRPENVVAICDSREQLPLTLEPLQVETVTLTTGDYSVCGLEHMVGVERKSLSDLLGCVGQQREQFARDLDRLRAFPHRFLAIEATCNEIQVGQRRSKATPQSVPGSLLTWSLEGLPIWFARDHHEAGRIASRFLFLAARRYWSSLRGFVEAALAEKEAA